ncbi:hypothetical protein MCEMSEM18_03525 [Comamonadaceae bacterium]
MTYLGDILTMAVIGAIAAIAIHMTEGGAALLGMPQWAWYLPLIFGGGSLVVYLQAIKLDPSKAKDFAIGIKMQGFFLFALIPALAMIAATSDLPQSTGAGGFGQLQANLIPTIGRFLAWGSLAVIPAFCFLGLVGCLAEIRKGKSSVGSEAA